MADKKKKPVNKAGDVTTLIERLNCLADNLIKGDWKCAWSDASDIIDELQAGFKGGKVQLAAAPKSAPELAKQLKAHATSLSEDNCFCEDTAGDVAYCTATAGGLDWAKILPLLLSVFKLLFGKAEEEAPAT